MSGKGPEKPGGRLEPPEPWGFTPPPPASPAPDARPEMPFPPSAAERTRGYRAGSRRWIWVALAGLLAVVAAIALLGTPTEPPPAVVGPPPMPAPALPPPPPLDRPAPMPVPAPPPSIEPVSPWDLRSPDRGPGPAR